ncbi:MAG: glycosyltransferase family 2 protein [Flavobacteriales bacterium]
MAEKLSIIIPAYNEEATIEIVLAKVRDMELLGEVEKELVVVDDASTDRTFELVEAFRDGHPDTDFKLLQQPLNKGKGTAVQRGLQEASGSILVIQDADLEYDPRSFNAMLEPILNGFADVVYGSRFKGGHPHRMLFFWHSIGNHMLTFFSNMFCNLNLSDMETCYKMVRKELVDRFELKEKGFGLEPELTAKLAKIPGIRIYEVGIPYYGRTYAEGKKVGWTDGFRAFWCVLKYNLFSK